ncbi:hypothetical protein M0R04_01690 [Candidatus Dojkabacteria bacterium]|jgi:hypothetical protein|nr:hypothetical protein [Candidatus Dojkabacteria bacterium]
MNISEIISQITNREYIYIGIIFAVTLLTSLFSISTITKNPKKGALLSLTTFIPLILYVGGYILIKWKLDQTSFSLYQTLLFLLLVIHSAYIIFLSEISNKKIFYLFPITFIILYAPTLVFYQTIRIPLALFGISFIIDFVILVLISLKGFKK